MKWTYYAGRAMQLIGIMAMPAAIWEAEIKHSEAGSISYFAGSIVVFFAGWLLTRK